MKMASKNRNDRVWAFTVSDAKMHQRGFTIYKVICKFFPINKPESLTEVVIWKRYNDIKQLHRAMFTLHRKLLRKDEFPLFAKPKLFGRFDEMVIEERKQSAVDLLNFIGEHPHLYTSEIFRQFFEGGEKSSRKREQEREILKPERIARTVPSTSPELSKKILEEGLAGVDAPAEPLLPEQIEQQKLLESSGDSQSGMPEELLGGIWQFPKVPDNLSLNSFEGDDDPDLTDVESTLSTPLPDSDIAFFDPLHPDGSNMTGDEDITPMPRSNSWLITALSTCAELEQHSGDFTPTSDPVSRDIADDSGINVNFDSGQKSDVIECNKADGVDKLLEASDILEIKPNMPDTTSTSTDPPSMSSNSSSALDLSDFDPYHPRTDSKVECGKGDLDLSLHGSGDLSLCSTPERMTTEGYEGQSPAHQSLTLDLNSSSPRQRTPTKDSVSNMDLGGTNDYIYLAAKQIAKAQESEANGKFENAFAYYKSGVGILLHGVQEMDESSFNLAHPSLAKLHPCFARVLDRSISALLESQFPENYTVDQNKARREAVRRKTGQYLMKAEDLYNRHLACESSDERRWATATVMSPNLSLDPSIAYLKAPASELKNYKVLGTVDKVLLVLDSATEQTFIIKTLHKSSISLDRRKANIVPTSCPYMVQFYKFYETENAIYLILQYASGGRLWEYIDDYLQYNMSGGIKDVKNVFAKNGDFNVYSGCKLHSEEEPMSRRGSVSPRRTFLKNDIVQGSDSRLSGVKKQSSNESSSTTTESSSDSKPDSPSLRIKFTTDNDSVDLGLDDEVITNTNTRLSPENKLTVNIPAPVSYNNNDNSRLRFSSLSSEEFHPDDYDDMMIQSPQVDKSPGGGFQELLLNARSKPGNGDFSINSFESDAVHRHDSNMSDHIESIAEVSEAQEQLADGSPEVFLKHTRISSDNSDQRVLHNTGNSTIQGNDNQTKPSDDSIEYMSISDSHDQKPPTTDMPDSYQSDADQIVENAKELLKSVENTLRIDSMGEANNESGPEQNVSPSYLQLNREVSIYDIYRSDDDERSSAASGGDVNGISSRSSDNIKDMSVDRAPTQDKGLSDTYTNNVTFDDGTNERTPHISANKNKYMSIKRMNSKEFVKSSSLEIDIKSPSKNRNRVLSSVFDQLDMQLAASTDSVKIPESCIKRWAAEIVVALNSLHSAGLFCRDLKPDNILLGHGGHVLLTFFSEWCTVEQPIDRLSVEQLYVAPEVRSIGCYTELCDWWSLGALLYELLVGKSLLCCHPGGVTSHTHLFIPGHLSAEAQSLLRELLVYNPRERLGAGITGIEEIKSHPFFHGIDWPCLTG